MNRGLFYTVGLLSLAIPRPVLGCARIPDPDGTGTIYMLHLGVRWMGFSSLMSLSCTDNRKKIRAALEDRGFYDD